MNKKKLIVIAFVGIIIVEGCAAVADKKPAKATRLETPSAAPADTIPSFQMKDSDSNPVTLKSLTGKKVFINIWASWCPPCRAEMPSIEKLCTSMDKNKVVFVMLSFDENPKEAATFKQTNKLSLPVYFPAEQPPAILHTDGIPATFIFDESGKLIKQYSGAEDYDTDAYRQLLQ